MKTNYKIIAQVKSGAFAKGFTSYGEASLQTYDSLESLVERLLASGEAKKGCWIVDARKVPLDITISEVFKGPIVLCTLKKDEKPVTCLSYITPKTYAKRWEALGAIVSQVD